MKLDCFGMGNRRRTCFATKLLNGVAASLYQLSSSNCKEIEILKPSLGCCNKCQTSLCTEIQQPGGCAVGGSSSPTSRREPFECACDRGVARSPGEGVSSTLLSPRRIAHACCFHKFPASTVSISARSPRRSVGSRRNLVHWILDCERIPQSPHLQFLDKVVPEESSSIAVAEAEFAARKLHLRATGFGCCTVCGPGSRQGRRELEPYPTC
uniref:Uncharacterized protein n=1 Tax=Ananas comosus var. bracteatus TaxID=296719 RepID=A0A6V7QKZ8_ANACO|nr:unnamed protein product [Ananas comosus var. bracteatus]